MAATSDRSFTSNTTLDLPRMLDYLPLAMGAYGTGPGTVPVSVGTRVPVELLEFHATSPAFQAGLYRDSITGKYTSPSPARTTWPVTSSRIWHWRARTCVCRIGTRSTAMR